MQEIAEYFYAHMYPHGPKILNYFMRITFITSPSKKEPGARPVHDVRQRSSNELECQKGRGVHTSPTSFPPPLSSTSSVLKIVDSVDNARRRDRLQEYVYPHVFGRPQSNSDPPTSSSARSHPQTPKSSSGHAGTHKVTIGGTSEYHRTASTPGARNIAVPLFSRSEYERRDGCRIRWTPSKVKLAYVQGT